MHIINRKNPPVISLPLVGTTTLKFDENELKNEYENNVEKNSLYGLDLCDESFLLYSYFVDNGFPCEFYRNYKIPCFSGCNTMCRILERMKNY